MHAGVESEFDLIIPLWVRGFAGAGAPTQGWCGLCPGDGLWLEMKDSSYW